MTLKTHLNNTQKCQCMALNADCTKLCIGVRKKTLIFTIHNNVFTFTNFIPSKETPMCMSWIDRSLFVGCKIAYYLQDVDAGAITKTVLIKAAKSWTSILTVTSSNHPEALLLDSDNTIVMVDKQGIPTHSVDSFAPILSVDGGVYSFDNATHSTDCIISLSLCLGEELSLCLQSTFIDAYSEDSSRRSFPHRSL